MMVAVVGIECIPLALVVVVVMVVLNKLSFRSGPQILILIKEVISPPPKVDTFWCLSSQGAESHSERQAPVFDLLVIFCAVFSPSKFMLHLAGSNFPIETSRLSVVVCLWAHSPR